MTQFEYKLEFDTVVFFNTTKIASSNSQSWNNKNPFLIRQLLMKRLQEILSPGEGHDFLYDHGNIMIKITMGNRAKEDFLILSRPGMTPDGLFTAAIEEVKFLEKYKVEIPDKHIILKNDQKILAPVLSDIIPPKITTALAY
jgi:hypothetical protein